MPTYPVLQLQPLPAFALELAPGPVREASEKYAASLARMRELQHAAQIATDAVDEAGRTDRRAAEDAVAKGKSVPDAKLPGAVAERDRAHRAMLAARDLAAADEQDLIRALAAGQDEYAQAAADAHDALWGEASALIDQLEGVCKRLLEVQRLRGELKYDIPEHARTITFDVAPQGRRAKRDALFGSPARAQLDGLREWASGQRPAGNRFVAGAAA